MKRMIVAAANKKLTQYEMDLIEGQCEQTLEAYSDEADVNELADIVWEHVEWLIEDMIADGDPEEGDISGNVNKRTVKQFAKKWFNDNK